MPKRDFTQIAFDVARQATGDAPKVSVTPRQENARKGGLKGGAKRMASLTEEERKALALKAAAARWNRSKTAPGPDGTGADKASKAAKAAR